MQALLQLFTKRLVLLHDQRAYEEQKGQYLHEKYYAYSCLLGVLAEDAPFCVLNTMYILRVLQDDAEGVCSPGYTLFDFQVPMTLFPAVSPEPSIPLFFMGQLLCLILLTSVAGLVYKLGRIQQLPGIWALRKTLQQTKENLLEREEQLSHSETEIHESDDAQHSVPQIDCSAAVQAAKVLPSSGHGIPLWVTNRVHPGSLPPVGPVGLNSVASLPSHQILQTAGELEMSMPG